MRSAWIILLQLHHARVSKTQAGPLPVRWWRLHVARTHSNRMNPQMALEFERRVVEVVQNILGASLGGVTPVG